MFVLEFAMVSIFYLLIEILRKKTGKVAREAHHSELPSWEPSLAIALGDSFSTHQEIFSCAHSAAGAIRNF